MRLTSAQTDRACGALLGAAVGDALGAGYEFGSARLAPDEQPAMIGGGLGGFAPGEWTDDTSLTWVVAEVAATGADLRTTQALDAIAAGIAAWYATNPADVGIQTSQVLDLVGPKPTAEELTAAARQVHDRTGRSGGNGSLMRTAAVALAHLDDPRALVDAAIAVSALTHTDPQAGEACALWCLAIRHAVLTGSFGDLREGLAHLPESSRDFWRARIDEAGERSPSSFTPNGYVVTALQAAWSAIIQPAPAVLVEPPPAVLVEPPPAVLVEPVETHPCAHLVHALGTAIHIGNDTDTVASIAGALLGARWGASAVPASWRRIVHGYPGRTAADLVDLALLAIQGGRPDRQGWPGCARVDYSGWQVAPVCVRHPYDDGVYLADATALDDPPDDVTAVVSLCRLGREQVPERLRPRHIDFRLLDTTAADNPNLAFVIEDAARTVAELREQGEIVLLHCVAAQSRTPTVAAAYGALLGRTVEQALADVGAVLPHAHPNPALTKGLSGLV